MRCISGGRAPSGARPLVIGYPGPVCDRFAARASRGFLLYLRDHHRFFGWLVVLTATAHAVLLLPVIDRVNRTEVITGALALVLLALLTGLGEWIELAVRRKRVSRNLRWVHTALAIAFLAAFALHA